MNVLIDVFDDNKLLSVRFSFKPDVSCVVCHHNEEDRELLLIMARFNM